VEDDVTDLGSMGVVCNDESHAGRVVKITKFARREDGIWAEVDRYREERYGSGEPELTATVRQRRTWAVLHGDTVARHPDNWQGGRLRYNLDCRRCGLTAVARAQTLYPILDTLAAPGVSSVTLAALRASCLRERFETAITSHRCKPAAVTWS